MVMVLVLLSAAAMLLGATFLLKFGLLDYKITANKENEISALYMAETGIETALGLLLKHNWEFRGDINSPFTSAGSFQAGISEIWGSDSDKWIKIVSEGNFNGINNGMSLQFQISPPLPPGAVNGAELGWFNYETGLIIKNEEEETQEEEPGDEIHYFSEDPVIFQSNAPGSGIIADIDGEVSFSAPFLFFQGERSLEMQGGQLTLSADEVVFCGELYLKSSPAHLTFSAFVEPETRVYFLKPFYSNGQVLVPSGTYLFPSGFTLHGKVSEHEVKQHQTSPVIPDSKRWLKQ